jgi:hypothetical protein
MTFLFLMFVDKVAAKRVRICSLQHRLEIRICQTDNLFSTLLHGMASQTRKPNERPSMSWRIGTLNPDLRQMRRTPAAASILDHRATATVTESP